VITAGFSSCEKQSLFAEPADEEILEPDGKAIVSEEDADAEPKGELVVVEPEGDEPEETERNEDNKCFSDYELTNELYYYSQGKKIFLEDKIINDLLYISFYPQVKNDEIIEYLNKIDLFKPIDDIAYIMRIPSDVEGIIPYEYNYARIYVSLKEDKTLEVLKETIKMLNNSQIVAFANLVFSFEFYNRVSFTPYFYVTVKNNNDLENFYCVLKETNTTIIDQPKSEYNKTFTLKVNKKSNFNALQISNYFYETGSFEHSAAGWVDFFAIRSGHSINKL